MCWGAQVGGRILWGRAACGPGETHVYVQGDQYHLGEGTPNTNSTWLQMGDPLVPLPCAPHLPCYLLPRFSLLHCLQQLPWEALDLMLQPFLELHLTPTMLLRLFLV